MVNPKNNNLSERVLMESDGDSLTEMEKGLLVKAGHPADQVMFMSWKAPWREESLQHYLPQGWSFGIFNNREPLAYFLAQPFLFMEGLTQSLWVEHLQCLEKAQGEQLLDIAYRLCREKHFQKLLLSFSAFNVLSIKGVLEDLTWVSGKKSFGQSHFYEVATSKINS